MFSQKLQQQISPAKHFKVFLFENSSAETPNENTLKEQQAKSVHRFILDQNGTTFEEFVQKLKSKSIVTSTNFKLYYLDDQNDWVSLGDEEDWKVLNSILSSETVIKIVCQNIVPKKESESSNPHCEFFKNFRKCHDGGKRQCPFGNARSPFSGPWTRGGCGRGSADFEQFSQFAPLIENVIGSIFNGQQQSQGSNPLGNLDLSSLLNGIFPGACPQSTSSQETKQEESKQETPNTPPQFNGLNDLIKNFCGNLNEKVDNGSFNIPHFGIVCDGCGKKNFTGPRWNCADCGDFDFCQECFETKANGHFDGFHSFTQTEPKAKSFLSNLMKNFEGNQTNTQPQEAPQTSSTPETAQEQLPEEKLDDVLYPSFENTPPTPVTTSQLLSSQLDEIPTAPIVVEQSLQSDEHSPVQIEFTFEQQLLKDMGFENEQANTRLLKKYNGDVQRVITDLI